MFHIADMVWVRISPLETQGIQTLCFSHAFLPLLGCEKGPIFSRAGFGFARKVGGLVVFEWLRGHIVSMLIVMLRDLAKSHCTSSLLGIPPEFIFEQHQAMWHLLMCQVAENLNDDPAYSSVGVRNQNLSSTKRYQKHQIICMTHHKIYGLRRIYGGFWIVLIESIMACGIVGFLLGIAFDLETTPYIYFELPGDLSARGPAASICAPHISHMRNRCDVGLRRHKGFLHMHGVICQFSGRQIERFLYVGGSE